MGNNIRSSSRPKALAPSIPMPPLADAMDAVHLSVDRFCLLAGVEALAEMMEEDATTVCGARHRRHGDRRGYRWGRTHSEIGYHGGKVKVARPRVRDRAGKEVSLESWQALRDGNLLLEWALNLMVLNVSTRKYHCAVRLPEGDLAKARGDGTSKSAVSRRFVALSRKKMKAWLASGRLEHEEPGVSGSILEGLEEILTVIRLGLPHELRRSLACTNIVENALGTVRQVTRNVKRWRHAEMALRWTAAGLLEAQKTFRRLKAYRQLPILRNALQEHLRKAQADSAIETIMKAA